MLERNKLVPELMVTNLQNSLRFWVSCLGFSIAYQRPEDGFAYLDLNGAQVMFEQVDPDAGQWLTAPLSKPFGRGINLQIDVAEVASIIRHLGQAGFALYRDAKTLGIALTTLKSASANSSFRIPMDIWSDW